jgi:hypothetical protein
MADTNTVVHIGDNSPQEVAYKLMRDIAHAEDKLLSYSEKNSQKVANRKWILDTYAECLRAVHTPNTRGAAAMIKDS